MPARPGDIPAANRPDCLSWGASYGSRSYCRACYDFTRRYPRGACGSCRRIIAVKKGHCRLCWLQAGITAGERRRITAADFGEGCGQQLSFAGFSRLGHAGPRPKTPPAAAALARLPRLPHANSSR